MTKVKLCSRAAALGLAFVAVVCEARDLKPVDLLERHIEARGGRSALEQVQHVERFGSFHAHAGANKIAGTYHTCLKYPDHVAISIDAGPIQMHQILIENVGLECQKGFDSCGSASRAVHEELSETARIANREELFEKIPAADAVEWIEREQEVTGYRFYKDGVVSERVFDPLTGLMSRKTIGSRTREYSGWRKTGPILLPMVYEDYQGGSRTTTISLDWVKVMDQPSPWCASAFGKDSDRRVPSE